MPESSFDFAVLGASPFAALLAISLKTVHGKNVCLIAQPPVALQLARSLDVSVAHFTRPENWDLLRRVKGETENLLGRLAPSLLSRTEIAFVADSPAGTSALSHARHMAAAHGFMTSPLEMTDQFHTQNGFTLEGAMRLRHRPFYANLDQWLKDLGIPSFTPLHAKMAVKRGHLVFNGGDEQSTAQETIITDEAFANTLLPKSQKTPPWISSKISTLLTEPGNSYLRPVVINIDAGFCSYAHPDGRIEAIGRGSSENVATHLSTLLSTGTQTRLAGMAHSTLLESVDGAPIIGQMGKSHLHVALALTPVSAFLAPVIARYFVGESSEAERQYFEAHAPFAPRQNIREFTTLSDGHL